MLATADQQAGALTNLSGLLLRLQRLEAEVEEVEQRWQQATDADEKSCWKDQLDMVQETKELLLQEIMLVRRAAVLMQQQAERGAWVAHRVLLSGAGGGVCVSARYMWRCMVTCQEKGWLQYQAPCLHVCCRGAWCPWHSWLT